MSKRMFSRVTITHVLQHSSKSQRCQAAKVFERPERTRLLNGTNFLGPRPVRSRPCLLVGGPETVTHYRLPLQELKEKLMAHSMFSQFCLAPYFPKRARAHKDKTALIQENRWLQLHCSTRLLDHAALRVSKLMHLTWVSLSSYSGPLCIRKFCQARASQL